MTPFVAQAQFGKDFFADCSRYLLPVKMLLNS